MSDFSPNVRRGVDNVQISSSNLNQPHAGFCSFCSAKLFEEAVFCHKCGNKVLREEVSKEAEQDTLSKEGTALNMLEQVMKNKTVSEEEEVRVSSEIRKQITEKVSVNLIGSLVRGLR